MKTKFEVGDTVETTQHNVRVQMRDGTVVSPTGIPRILAIVDITTEPYDDTRPAYELEDGSLWAEKYLRINDDFTNWVLKTRRNVKLKGRDGGRGGKTRIRSAKGRRKSARLDGRSGQ